MVVKIYFFSYKKSDFWRKIKTWFSNHTMQRSTKSSECFLLPNLKTMTASFILRCLRVSILISSWSVCSLIHTTTVNHGTYCNHQVCAVTLDRVKCHAKNLYSCFPCKLILNKPGKIFPKLSYWNRKIVLTDDFKIEWVGYYSLKSKNFHFNVSNSSHLMERIFELPTLLICQVPSIFSNVWNSKMFQYHFCKWNGPDRLLEC